MRLLVCHAGHRCLEYFWFMKWRQCYNAYPIHVVVLRAEYGCNMLLKPGLFAWEKHRSENILLAWAYWRLGSHIQPKGRSTVAGMETVAVDEIGHAGRHHEGELPVGNVVETKWSIGWLGGWHTLGWHMSS